MAEPAKAERNQLARRGGQGDALSPAETLNIVSLVSARDLAAAHVPLAINTLVALTALRGRQAGVARAAARDLIDIACPDLEDEVIAQKVAAQLQRMVVEAEAARAKETP